MKIETFVKLLGADFYTGVPDSQLRALCDYLIAVYGARGEHHMIAANEGNAAALATGHYLSTGKVPVVYMQNSGIGNAVNPLASLMNEAVYGIPCILVVGWRGEPGVHDEPQHKYQGMVTLRLLEDMDVATFVLDKDTTDAALEQKLSEWQALLSRGKQVAIVVKKGALENENKLSYKNENTMLREEIIRHIVRYSGDGPVVSTTGKTSRELFEIREAAGSGHQRDFLTVGSMGHSSSIALGIALAQPEIRVWCVDGDGAMLMHMGALAVTGTSGVKNLVHVVINNAAHESVGGMPTAAAAVDLAGIAKVCGYTDVYKAATFEELDDALWHASHAQSLTFIEVRSAIGSRADLGRPTTSPAENRDTFMGELLKA